jgi:hypothetical protein
MDNEFHKKTLILGGILVLALSVGIATLERGGKVAYNQSQGNSKGGSAYGELSDLTNKMLGQVVEFKKGKAASEQMVAAATARKSKMAELAKTDPEAVLAVALDQNAAKDYPSQLKNALEQEVTIDGTLETFVLDFFEEKMSIIEYKVKANSKEYDLYTTGEIDQDAQSVKVRGVVIDNALVAKQENIQVTGKVKGVSTITNKKVAVMLVNFQNDTSQPLTADYVRASMFTDADSASAFYSESSFGSLNLTGDVLGYYTIPVSSGTCSTTTYANAADTAATNAGVNLSGYTNKMYLIKDSSCSWGGLGNRPGPRSWVNTAYGLGGGGHKARVTTHELGHNFGASHASTYNCGSVSIAPSCALDEYGDPFTSMGIGYPRVNQHNSTHKGMFGYYASGNVRTVTASGIHTLASAGISTSALQSLTIPRPVSGGSYNLEFRRPIGVFDNFSATEPVANGISIRIDGVKTMLIDATPGDSNFGNSALGVGQTFTDANNGISVTTVSADELQAVVNVSVSGPPCVRANPTVTISPSTAWVQQGASSMYTVTVRNNDSSSCSQSSFLVNPTLSAGMTQTPTSLSMNIAPGATTSGSISVTNGNVPGTYQFTQTAVNSDSGLSASATANNNVNVPPQLDTTPPTVTLTSPANGSKLPSKGNTTLTAMASDNLGVTKVEFWIDGKIEGSDASSPYSLRLNTGKVPAGTHTIQARAYDAAGNTSSSSVSVTK